MGLLVTDDCVGRTVKLLIQSEIDRQTYTYTHAYTHARTHARTHAHADIIFINHLAPRKAQQTESEKPDFVS